MQQSLVAAIRRASLSKAWSRAPRLTRQRLSVCSVERLKKLKQDVSLVYRLKTKQVCKKTKKKKKKTDIMRFCQLG